MTGPDTINRGYMVSIRRDPDTPDVYVVFYVPRSLEQVRARRVPKYDAFVDIHTDPSVRWDKEPSDPQAQPKDFDEDTRNRAMLLHQWLGTLSRLLYSVRNWAEKLGWSTKEIEKPMYDSEVGDYKAPALLLQKETTRALLEPIGRSAPGVQGPVDLDLMPAYDDIASLYFYDNRWNLHYMAPGTLALGKLAEVESKPLTKATLGKLLNEMKEHVQ